MKRRSNTTGKPHGSLWNLGIYLISAYFALIQHVVVNIHIMKAEKTHNKTDYIISEFDCESASNIHCIYDMGSSHTDPVWQNCETCLMVNGTITPLCTSCGYHYNGMKVCNDCYSDLTNKREREWTTQNT